MRALHPPLTPLPPFALPRRLLRAGHIREEEWAQRRKGILEQQETFKRVNFTLPMEISMPLRLLLGQVNLTLPMMTDRCGVQAGRAPVTCLLRTRVMFCACAA